LPTSGALIASPGAFQLPDPGPWQGWLCKAVKVTPAAWFVVDELSLYRRVGSPETMATQIRHLLAVAAMPRVTMQVLPAIAHPCNASELIIADTAAYCEHMAGGYAYTDAAVISSLSVRFDALRAECYRASESMAMMERMCGSWETGASLRIQTRTADPA
jgi:hypothetical protein